MYHKFKRYIFIPSGRKKGLFLACPNVSRAVFRFPHFY